MPTLHRLLPIASIVLISLAALYVIWPSNPDRYLPSVVPWPSGGGVDLPGIGERRAMRLGLDLQGGTRLLLGATLPEGEEGDIDDAIEGTMSVLRRRVDASGVAEAEISRQGASNISVQLPGLTPDEARDLLGRTAQLRFCQQLTVAQPPGVVGAAACGTTGGWAQAYGVVDGVPLALTGRFLRPNSFISTDLLGNPEVAFEWRDAGPELFEQITTRLINQPLGIFLDDELLSSPTVNAVIRDRGIITGVPLERGRQLVVQLNSGALPVELTVLQEQTVDATLGEDSVRRSLVAGEVGFLIVVLFMVLYYRLPGVLAAVALVNYAVISLALFKLIPVTLTLAGIGAFVLSVGMAVDANVLIFERMKEELRAGRGYTTAVEVGFRRAWPSIRDSNVTTMITAAILWLLGGGGISIPGLGAFEAPLVQGFALVLLLGVLVSMFSAIVVTRSLLRLLVGTPIARRQSWMSPDVPDAAPEPAGAGGEA
ncbi:MAG: protein translocase subunit SecD [Dehalococcoidia bacterium]|jgi:preprotein translocase subunit SecD|nr:protein translocase subunit SecD [Dehalococcoidia bacterium]